MVGIVPRHPTVARVAEGLGVAWATTSEAVLAAGKQVLIEDPVASTGSPPSGSMSTCAAHSTRGPLRRYDHRPHRCAGRRRPARLLNMVEGRSMAVFMTWLANRPQSWRDGVEVVAMNGISGSETATTEEQPEAVPVTDPFHVIRLNGDAPDQCRRRARRTLQTGAKLLTDRQRATRGPIRRRRSRRSRGHLGRLPEDDQRLPGSWPGPGRATMTALIATLGTACPYRP